MGSERKCNYRKKQNTEWSLFMVMAEVSRGWKPWFTQTGKDPCFGWAVGI